MEYSFKITAVHDWLQGFPEVPRDPTLDFRVRTAFDHPSTADQREHSRRALNNLARFGLVVDDSVASPASYIVNILQTPRAQPLRLHYGDKLDIPIPYRSLLTLQHLSHMLPCNIFLFSSRSTPIAFTQDSATSTLALFHDVDSFTNKSRYLPLTAAKGMVPGPRPVAEPRATQSLVPAATYRVGKRKAKTIMGRPLEEDEMEENVCRYFRQACLDSLKTQIQKRVVTPVSKKLKSKEGRAVAMEERRDATFDSLVGMERVPRDTFTTSHQRFVLDHQLGATYGLTKFHRDVPRHLGPPVLYWRGIVEKEFGRIWATEIADASTDTSTAAGSTSAGSSSTGVSSAGASSSSTGLSSSVGSSSTSSSAALDPAPASSSTADASMDDPDPNNSSDTSKRDLRTCPATLKQILRTDILPEYDNLVSITRQRQLAMTDILTEVSVVIQKAILLLASGRLNGEIGLPEPITTTFDIRRALPPDFVFRAKIDPLVKVAELPDLLQGALERGHREKKSGPLWDLTKILSPQCISYLYAAFFGASGSYAGSKHPLWDKIIELISELSKVSSLSLSSSPAGLSHTITEHLTLLATAIGNLWDGSVYDRCMDYTFRILLRLRLAPEREAKNKARILQAAQKKREIKKQPKRMSHSQWEMRVRHLCDELAFVLCSPHPKESRIQGIAKQLCDLNAVKPVGAQVHIPPIQEQLDKALIAASAVDSSQTPNPSVAPAPSFPTPQPLDPAVISVESPVGSLPLQEHVALASQDPVDEFSDDIVLSVDDIDALFEDDEDDSSLVMKEPTRARLKALQALLKLLVESPHIEGEINMAWVRRSGFAKDEFTDKECSVVAELANLFRPYTPKRRPAQEGTKTDKPLAHVALRAPFVLIGNAILRASGYPEFTRKIAPQISAGTVHALQLGPVGFYEVFCSENENQYDIQDSSGNPITSVKAVTSPPANKEVVLESFLDMDVVRRICRKHGLKFANRITIVDEFTVQIMGEVLTKNGDIPRHPVTSKYEQRKKNRAGSAGNYWTKEFQRSGLTKAQVYSKAEKCADNVKEQEAVVKQHRAVVAQLVQVQSAASEAEKRERTKQSYEALRTARKNVRQARQVLAPLQEVLRVARREKYYWNKVYKAPVQDNAESPARSAPVRDSVPTWDHPAVEDRAERIDISQLLQNCRGKDRQVVFGATDYGLVTMSETVGFTLPQIQCHLNRYDRLQEPAPPPEPPPAPAPDPVPVPAPGPAPAPAPAPATATAPAPASEPAATLDTFTKLPKSYRMTAGQIDQVSHAKGVAKTRVRRLAKSEAATKAMASVSETRASLSWADTMASIDLAHSIRKEAAGTLRGFELGHARLRDKQRLRLRTGKCWKRVCAAERRHVQGALSTDLPGTPPAVLPIMLIGDAGTCVGSRLKGHSRRGGSKMRAQHRQYCPVAIVDEYRTSRVCFYCFQEMQMARSRRVKGQAIRTVRVHGALECTNHECVAVKGRYCIRPRDTHASAVIGLSGVASLTRPTPLAPFQRSYNPDLHTNHTSAIPGPTILSSTSTLMRGQPPTDSGLV
ncbi:hypothetical protein EC968_001673 [Mortierella alpina]|nr:hypothetical protein EC968_001673 [Mortierella alpina]